MRDRAELGGLFAIAGNDDRFALLRQVDQSAQIGPGFLDRDSFHDVYTFRVLRLQVDVNWGVGIGHR